VREERLIIVGDLLNNRFGLSLPSKAFTVDVAQEVQSVKKVAGLDFNAVCFGHGSPLLHEAHAAIARFADKLEKKYPTVDSAN